jgi:hypothetical protein
VTPRELARGEYPYALRMSLRRSFLLGSRLVFRDLFRGLPFAALPLSICNQAYLNLGGTPEAHNRLPTEESLECRATGGTGSR